ncbi:MAG: hypothetical protein EA374_06865 [Acholeplasmatales bacterium]|nr:MAG: hypothetical protein EA374_06865 [Acholeplasmatales bacterium]
MRRGDLWHGFLLVLVMVLLVLPSIGGRFFTWSDQTPLVGGFIKFFLFASYGDVLSHRLKKGDYHVRGLFFKAVVWGLIGVVIVWIFTIYSHGIRVLQTQNLLLGHSDGLVFAFFVSVFMNLTFAPAMMLFHRLSDHYIEHRLHTAHHTFAQTIEAIDYRSFVSFVLFKTIPFFWIPAHTITFMLPGRYRVFFAALLGVALGLILGLAKQSPTPKEVA